MACSSEPSNQQHPQIKRQRRRKRSVMRRLLAHSFGLRLVVAILGPQQISLESQSKKKIPHVESPTRSVSGQGGAQSSPQAASGCRRRCERCGGHRSGRGIHLLARQLDSPPAGLGEGQQACISSPPQSPVVVETCTQGCVTVIRAGQTHGGAGDPR
jgi:hypothetical protein